MLIISIIYTLLSNAVNFRREPSARCNRISILILLHPSLISYVTTNNNSYNIKKVVDKMLLHINYIIILKLSVQALLIFIMYKAYCLDLLNFQYKRFIYNLLLYLWQVDYIDISLNFFNNISFKTQNLYIEYLSFTNLHVYILSTIFTFLFVVLFLKNFISKHLYYFNGLLNKNESRLFIFVVIIIILFFPRILFKYFILKIIFFEEVTYISLTITILWMLPFMSYIFNLLNKVITKQKIEKEDWNILNNFVANSINIYTVCFILISVYLYLKYSGYVVTILLSIFKHIYLSSSGICHISGSGSLSIDMPRVFCPENSSYREHAWPSESNEVTKSWSFKEGLSNIVRGQWIMDNPFGKTEGSIRGYCYPMKQLFGLSNNINNKPLLETFAVSHNKKFHSAHILVDNINGKRTLFLAAKGTGHQDGINKTKDWIQYHTKEKDLWFGILDSHGVYFPNLNRTSITDLILSFEPEASKNVKNNCFTQTELFKYQYDNLTRFHKLGYGKDLPEPFNYEDIFNSSYRKYFLPKIVGLNLMKNSLSGMNNNWEEMVFCNKIFAGFYIESVRDSKGRFIITDQNSTDNIPYIKCVIDNKHTYEALYEMKNKFGLLQSRENNPVVPRVTAYVPIIPLDDIFYKVCTHTMHINPYVNNYYTRINFPYEKFISYPITRSYQYISEKIINMLKGAVSCLDSNLRNRTTDNNWYLELSKEDQKAFQELLKLDIINSLAEDITSARRYLHFPGLTTELDDCSIDIFKPSNSIIDPDYLILCRSKTALFKGIDWQLGDREINIPKSVDSDLKKLMIRFIHHNSDLFQPPINSYCLHNVKLNILFLDNFNAEFVIAESKCASYCRMFDEHFLPSVEYVVWKDENGDTQKTMNLLEIEDLKLFFKYINKFFK